MHKVFVYRTVFPSALPNYILTFCNPFNFALLLLFLHSTLYSNRQLISGVWIAEVSSIFLCLDQHVIPFWQFFFFLRETICFISNNFIFVFCLLQLAEPYYAFKAAGFEVTIASTAGGAIPIDAGSMKGDAFTAGKYLSDAGAM